MTGKHKIVAGLFTVLIIAAIVALLILYPKGKNNEISMVEEPRENRTYHVGEIREEFKPAAPGEVGALTMEGEEVPAHDESAGKTPAVPAAEVDEYGRLLEQMKRFCAYLDSREYVKAHEVDEGTWLRMLSLIARLMDSEPFVVAETMDMQRLASNVYHFYRVLGKEDTLFAAQILRMEREKLEAVMDLSYRLLILDMEQGEPKTAVSVEGLYHYGAFFLSTLGGSSYLSRRDSRTAFLVRYYSLLFVDLADRQTKNPYGLDLLPHAERLLADLEVIRALDKADQYEARVREIRDRLLRR